ncbi:hypothetical protein [Numidum massiliense]|nr:hypothetical protein [Numidum massiliense]
MKKLIAAIIATALLVLPMTSFAATRNPPAHGMEVHIQQDGK